MAPNESIVRFGFAGGVETKQDEKSVPTAKLLVLQNGVFTKATSIKKRNGYESIATITGGKRLAQRGDTELLAFTDNRAYSIAADGSTSDTGAVYSAVGSDQPLVVTGTQQTQPDHATLSDVTVAAWEDSNGGVWWNVLDATSGRNLTTPAQADANGQSPRCVAVGGNLHVYYVIPTTHRIMVIVVDPANPSAAVTPAILTDDIDGTNTVYDAVPTTRTGTPAVMAWAEQGTTNFRIAYIDASGAIGTPLLGHPSSTTYTTTRGATTPLAIAYWNINGGASDILALAFNNGAVTGVIATFTGGNTSTAIASTSAYLAYSGTSITRCALAITSSSSAVAAFEEAAAQPSNRFTVSVPSLVPAGVTGTQTTIRSVGLASRAWARGGQAFAVFVHDTTGFNVYTALRLGDFVPVGRHAPGNAGGAPTRKHLSSVHADGDVYTFALPFKQRLISENDDKFTQTATRLFRLDFDSALSHQYANFGRGLYLGGACPMHYDGSIWSELGFHVGPELIATVSAGGGSMTSSTTYLYRAWYEWTDAQGEVHPGPVSAGTVVTMGGGDTQVTLTLPTLRLTRKSNVRIMVARSRAANTGDTAELRRVTSLDPTTAGTANGYVANSTSADTVSFLDRMSDATLATFDEIYTDDGILSNDPAPLGAALARGKTRLFGSDPSDGSVVRYTQPFSDGFGAQLPPELSTRVDPPAGNVTALGSLDDRVIIWTERAIFGFAGDGPDETGSANSTGFSRVQVVPGDVGCTEPASVILIPGGFMFSAGDRGIWMLGGDAGVRYIGAPVEAFNGQTIRRATALPGRTAVVFLTDSGSTLLYDYLFDQWSTFTNHEGLDSVVVNDEYHYLRNDGRIYRETIDAFSDAGQRITLVIQTAWIHMLEQLQGWQLFGEMHLLGTWLSAHQLGIQYQLDYQTGLSDVVWLDATGDTSSTGWITGTNANTIGVEPISGSEYGDGEYGDGEYGGTPPGEYAWRLDLYEPAHSIQFRFQDFEAATVTPGASFELTELVLIGTTLGNVRRPSTAGRSA